MGSYNKVKQTQRFCPTCKRNVLAQKVVPMTSCNHILHLILSIITGGIWINVWLLCAWGSGGPMLEDNYRCIRCGHAFPWHTEWF